MTIIIWSIVGVIVLVCAVMFIGGMRFRHELNNTGADYFIQFIEENKDSPRFSMVLQYNQAKLIELRPEEPLPLASTVKIIIAIEYARQAAEGRIDPEMEVELKALNQYYVPKTDGGAHEAWIAHLGLKEESDTVPVSEIAYGMIAFSSNANTEYLMGLLGLDSIQKLITELDLQYHEPLYPLVSSLFVASDLMKEQQLTKGETLSALKQMDLADYRLAAIQIHNRISSSPLTAEDKQKLSKWLSLDVQKVWSDRLPRSTTRDYVSIMEKLNSKSYFFNEVHQYLDPVMEGLMRDSRNQEWLQHAGQKGGSTMFVLTNAMYATDNEGNTLELAVFMTDLTWKEQAKLSHSLNSFQLKLLTDETVREHLKGIK